MIQLSSPCRAALAALFLAPLAAAGTFYVDAGLVSGAGDGSSWADAFQGAFGLQAAFSAAGSGDQIFVREGRYLPSATGVRTVSFQLENGLEVYGGFLGGESSPAQRPPFGSAPTILDGDFAGNDGANVFTENTYHVLNGAGTNATAVLDGFVVRGGNANGTGNNDKGGGILCLAGASPTIRNCSFEANRCTFGGGAGYINGSAPSFENCIFLDNIGGSFGGAFDMASAGTVRFDRCTFRGNRAARAGALEIFSSNGVRVTNSLFVANLATGTSGGGAIWSGSSSNILVRNCTIVANSATNQAVGGLRNQSGTAPSTINCIFWDNAGTGGAQAAANQTNVAVSYSIVEGGATGTGNSAADPQFANALGGDYALGATSPAIDAGDNAGVPAGVLLDLAGGPRLVDVVAIVDTGAGTAPIVDIGAFERADDPYPANCFGNGTGTACPCANDSPAAHPGGCAHQDGPGAILAATGLASVANDTLTFALTSAVSNSFAILVSGDNALPQTGPCIGCGIVAFDGLRCAGGNLRRHGTRATDAIGAVATGWGGPFPPAGGLIAANGFVAGQTRHFFAFFRTNPAQTCFSGQNSSNARAVTFGN